MKQGRTISEVAAQIKRENEEKQDFIASTSRLEYVPETDLSANAPYGAIRFKVDGKEFVTAPTRHCLRQIGEHTGIPSKYLDRMTGDPENRQLLARNINHWFQKEPSDRMLRTLINGEQTARAFLSNGYHPRDNAQLAEAVFPAFEQSGCEIKSCEITEQRLYIQVVTPRIELNIPELMKQRGIAHVHDGYYDNTKRPDDIVQAGAVISNSEVGGGATRVEQLIWRLRCYNGLIMPEAVRSVHIGRRFDLGEMGDVTQFLSDETRQLDDRAFFAKVRDVVNAVFNKDSFANIVERFAVTQGIALPGAKEGVKIVTDRFRLTDSESNSVLDHLIAGKDMSVFGLVNAVTRTAEDVESYDRAVEFERMGGDILALPTKTWSKN